jgi:hypothetical protein
MEANPGMEGIIKNSNTNTCTILFFIAVSDTAKKVEVVIIAQQSLPLEVRKTI